MRDSPRMSEVGQLLGVGLYSVPEAARIAKVSGRSVTRWMLGYQFRLADGSARPMPALWRRDFDETEVIALTFRDLLEVRFVNAFRLAGVSWHVIRRSAEVAAELFGASHPFSSQRFITDGRLIFADTLRSCQRINDSLD